MCNAFHNKWSRDQMAPTLEDAKAEIMELYALLDVREAQIAYYAEHIRRIEAEIEVLAEI